MGSPGNLQIRHRVPHFANSLNIAAAKAVYREFLYRMDGFERENSRIFDDFGRFWSVFGLFRTFLVDFNSRWLCETAEK